MRTRVWIFCLCGGLLLAACGSSGSGEGPVLVAGPEAFVTNFEGIEGIRWIYETPGLPCPDGLPGRFQVIAGGEDAAGAPLVVVLHGGAFDYVKDDGRHLAPVDKLTRDWAECKLRDFLGEPAPGCDDPEANGGAIVAALIERGAVAVLPANCWGDLWHGTGYRDDQDGFARRGLRLAREAAAFVQREHGTRPGDRYAWGTSAGGHGAAELVVAGEEPVRVLADSSADYLPGAADADPQAYPIWRDYPAIQEGFRRIFEGDGSDEHVGRYSLAHAVGHAGWGGPILYLFSCNDTELPPAVTEPAARAILEQHPAPQSCCVLHARDPAQPDGPDLAGHVFSNGRLAVARAGTAWLLDGQRPPACATGYRPCP